MRAAVWRVPSRGRTDPSGEDAIPEKHQGHSDKLTCRVWPWRFSSRPASIQALGERPSITWDFHPNRDQTCSRLRLIHCTLPFGRCSLTPELSRTALRPRRCDNYSTTPRPRSGLGLNELLCLIAILNLQLLALVGCEPEYCFDVCFAVGENGELNLAANP